MEQTIICRPARLEFSPATLISTVLSIFSATIMPEPQLQL